MKMLIGFWFPVTVILLFLAKSDHFAQNTTSDDLKTRFSFDNPRYARTVVAKVGDHMITAQEFLSSYVFGPAFAKREKNSRRHYLDFMICEKLLALDGYAHRLDTSGIVRQTLAEIEGDLATEELYKDDVLKKEKVTEQEIQKGIQKERLHISVQWLYAKSKDNSDHQLRLLTSGIPFDSLFSLQLKDSVKSDDRSMEMSRFRIELKNPVLSRVIDTLKPGSWSMPISAPDGYYIVKVTGRWMNPVTTETEEIKLRSDIERALVQSKSDSLSDLYVRGMIEGQHPMIIRRPFDILQVFIARKVLPKDTFSQWRLAERLLERWDAVADSGIVPYEKQMLVRLDDHRFTVKDFLTWYGAREYNLRLNSSSPEAFFSSLEQSVWQMVRDRLLMKRALSRGLQRRKVVREQCRWWEDKIIYKLVRGALADSIQQDDSLLQKYYLENQRNYRSAEGEIVPFDKVKDDVRKDYCAAEVNKRLLHRILKLKGIYNIEVREEELKNLLIDEENLSSAIDVYVVKKGGTFPRQAFPAIDYEWQTWE